MRRAMLKSFITVASLLVGFAVQTDAWGESQVHVDRLRCEYQINPLGIDATTPSFAWLLLSQERGQKQTAYQVLVADNPEKLAGNQGNCGTAVVSRPAILSRCCTPGDS